MMELSRVIGMFCTWIRVRLQRFLHCLGLINRILNVSFNSKRRNKNSKYTDVELLLMISIIFLNDIIIHNDIQNISG